MKKESRWRSYLTALLFTALLAISIVFFPNLSSSRLDSSVGSQQPNAQLANDIKNHWGRNLNNTNEMLLVFSNGNYAITTNQQRNINKVVTELQKNKSDYNIKSMKAPFDNPDTQKKLVSKDKSTEVVQIEYDKSQPLKFVGSKIYEEAKDTGASVFITGSQVINSNVNTNNFNIAKTIAIVALVALALLILFVFRSLIAALIGVTIAGISYLTVFTAIANDWVFSKLPINSFALILISLILLVISVFDYLILYREYRNKHNDIRSKYKLISKINLVIAIMFVPFYFGSAQVKSYALTTIAIVIYTILFILGNLAGKQLMGEEFFWGSRKWKSLKANVFWQWLSDKAVKFPLLSSIGVVLLLAPLGLSAITSYHLNYDNKQELPNLNQARQGNAVLQQHFSKGYPEPTTIYIKANHALDNSKSLSEIDKVTQKIAKNSYVKSVESITEPNNDAIKELYINNQLGSVIKGLNTIDSSSVGTVSSNSYKDSKKVDDNSKSTLASDSNKSTKKAIKENNAKGKDSKKNPLADVKSSNATSTAQNNNSSSNSNKTGLNLGFSDLPLKDIVQAAQAITTQLKTLNISSNDTSNDILSKLQGQSLTSSEYQLLIPILQETKNSSNRGQAIQDKLSGIINEVKKIGDSTKTISQEINTSNKKIMKLLTKIAEYNKNVTSAKDYLSGLKLSGTVNSYYIPKAVLQGNVFKQNAGNYLSEDAQMTQIKVVLNIDPSSAKAATVLDGIKEELNESIKGTDLSGSQIATAGATSDVSDTHSDTKRDIITILAIVSVVLFIMFMMMSKSILIGIYSMISMFISFVVSAGLSARTTNWLLGYDGLGYALPIMLFVLNAIIMIILVALFKHYYDKSDKRSTKYSLNSKLIHAIKYSGKHFTYGGTYLLIVSTILIFLSSFTSIQLLLAFSLAIIIHMLLAPVIVMFLINVTYNDNKFDILSSKFFRKFKKHSDEFKNDTAERVGDFNKSIHSKVKGLKRKPKHAKTDKVETDASSDDKKDIIKQTEQDSADNRTLLDLIKSDKKSVDESKAQNKVQAEDDKVDRTAPRKAELERKYDEFKQSREDEKLARAKRKEARLKRKAEKKAEKERKRKEADEKKKADLAKRQAERKARKEQRMQAEKTQEQPVQVKSANDNMTETSSQANVTPAKVDEATIKASEHAQAEMKAAQVESGKAALAKAKSEQGGTDKAGHVQVEPEEKPNLVDEKAKKKELARKALQAKIDKNNANKQAEKEAREKAIQEKKAEKAKLEEERRLAREAKVKAKAEAKRKAQEQAEQEKLAKQKAKEQAEKAKQAELQAIADKKAKEQAEKERLAKLAQEKREQEKLAKQKAKDDADKKAELERQARIKAKQELAKQYKARKSAKKKAAENIRIAYQTQRELKEIHETKIKRDKRD